MNNTIPLKRPPGNPIFLVGASGRGITSLSQLAASLPGNFPCPVVLLLHMVIDNSRAKTIDYLIRPKSRLVVEVARDGGDIKPGTIYVGALQKHLIINEGKFRLEDEPHDSRWRPGIDQLFISGAKNYRENTISVLLSGGLDDGVKGLIETTKQGGITIAQSPEDAYNPVLPLNAILNDHPSYVLPIADMAQLFCELAGIDAFENQEEIIEKAALTALRKK